MCRGAWLRTDQRDRATVRTLRAALDGRRLNVFARFDAQDSGNVSFGIEFGERRFFIKTAGQMDAEHAVRVERLRNAIDLAHSCSHPALVPLREVCEMPTWPAPSAHPLAGPWLVYDWFAGELLRKRARFVALPVDAITRCLDTIFDLHVALANAGWIACDFYDGALMYDFATTELRVIDLDSYHRGPFTNTMGRMFGSTRFMAPEEFERGALIDERTTVFTLGRTAFVLLGEGDAFRGSPSRRAVAERACRSDRAERFATVRELRDAWDHAGMNRLAGS